MDHFFNIIELWDILHIKPDNTIYFSEYTILLLINYY